MTFQASGNPLAHSPAQIIRQMMVDLELGVNPGSKPWPIAFSSEPDKPDEYISVFDTQGWDSGRSMPTGENFNHHGIQVRVRSREFSAGWVKVENIRTTFESGVNRRIVVLDTLSYRVYAMARISRSLALGKDVPATMRSIFTLNCGCAIDRIG